MELLESLKKNNFDWIPTLQLFCTQNATAMTFVDKFGVNWKRDVVKEVLCLLRQLNEELQTSKNQKQAEEGLKNLMDIIRLFCREKEGIEEIEESSILGIILRLCNFDRKQQVPDTVSTEASKALVNILIKLPKSSDILIEMSAPAQICVKLEELSNGKYDPKTQFFPLFRIILLLSVKDPAANVFNEKGIVVFLIKFLKYYVNNPYPAASDLLKSIFALTMNYGPLNGPPKEPSHEELKLCKKLASRLKKILLLSDTFHSYKLDALNCVINLPKSLYDSFVDQSVVDSLLHILSLQIKETEKPVDALTTILMVLTQITRNVNKFKNSIRKFVFPASLIQESGDLNLSIEGVLDEKSIAGKISKYMMNPNSALKHYSQDFLYALCNDDSDEFVKIVGFGPGAAKLAEEGGLLQSLGAVAQKKQGSNSDNTKSKPAETKKQEEEESSSSSDEQEEEEARQLAEKLHRLDQLGFISMMKGDPKTTK